MGAALCLLKTLNPRLTNLCLGIPLARDRGRTLANPDGVPSNTEVPKGEWQWLGYAAHLIVGRNCQFHLATVIGDHLVSTVGEYVPDAPVREIFAESRGVDLKGMGDSRLADYMRKVGFEEIGAGRLYETMVFRVSGEVCTDPECNCGGPTVEEWSELDANGYNERGEATRGHMEMCERWASK